MKLSFGLNTKLFILIGLISISFLVSGIFLYVKYQDILYLNNKQNEIFSNIWDFQDYQIYLEDANLAAMDIIVERANNINNNRVSPERIEKVKKSEASFIKVSNKVSKKITDPQIIADSNIAISETKSLFSGVYSLISFIDSGSKTLNSLEKFDKSIDKSKENASNYLDKIRFKYIDEKNLTEKMLSEKMGNLASIFLYLFAFIFGFLIFIVLPYILLFITKDIEIIKNKLNKSTINIKNSVFSLNEISKKMSDSSSQTSSAIHTSVSSISEITSMLAQTTKNTIDTSNSAKEVLIYSNEGSEIMQQLSISMSKISNANNHLQDIVKIIDDINGKTNVINDIVFKTQLLAVNASIEAARAGQHGKGFSVVANEVSNLATLSGNAAGEIRELLKTSSGRVLDIINSTSETVKSGEYVSHHAIESFSKIASSISSISTKISNIETASKEQETGIQQASVALNQMNTETINNKELAIENNNLSEVLMNEAKILSNIKKELNIILKGKNNKKIDKKKHKDKNYYFDIENLENSSFKSKKLKNHSHSKTEGNSSYLNKKKLASFIVDKFNKKKQQESNEIEKNNNLEEISKSVQIDNKKLFK
ncbi:methyl-accepting chemotaxis protein [Spirobacillus cienkowskii]|uniref:methyl-accepting chemotaxis protein n=1 Tax=Spirobacillus cienkowskii TaxID=495820 RepID=UPI0030CA9122